VTDTSTVEASTEATVEAPVTDPHTAANAVLQPLLEEVATGHQVLGITWEGNAFRAELANEMLVARGWVGVVRGAADEDTDSIRARARMLAFTLSTIESSGLILRFGRPTYVEAG